MCEIALFIPRQHLHPMCSKVQWFPSQSCWWHSTDPKRRLDNRTLAVCLLRRHHVFWVDLAGHIAIPRSIPVVPLHQRDVSTTTDGQNLICHPTRCDQFFSAECVYSKNSLNVRGQKFPYWVKWGKLPPCAHRNRLHHQVASKQMSNHLREILEELALLQPYYCDR